MGGVKGKRGGKRAGAGRPKGALGDIATEVRSLVAELLATPSPFDATGKQTRLERIVARACDQAEGGDSRAREWLCGGAGLVKIEASGTIVHKIEIVSHIERAKR